MQVLTLCTRAEPVVLLRSLMDLNSSDEETEAEVVVPAELGPSEHDAEAAVVVPAPGGSPPPSTALIVAPEWQRLTSYLEAHGGSAALVTGWRTRTGRRTSGGGKRGGGKAHDVYYYDENNTKFRSCKEVAQHFGLIDASNRIVGECLPAEVDAKLWSGASAQGWAVFCTRDGHRRYTAPDGRKLARKEDAHEWRADAAAPPKRRRPAKPATAATALTSPPLLLTCTDSTASALTLRADPGSCSGGGGGGGGGGSSSSSSSSTPGDAPAAVRARLARIGLEQYARQHVMRMACTRAPTCTACTCTCTRHCMGHVHAHAYAYRSMAMGACVPNCRPWSLPQRAALSPLRSTAPRNAGAFTHVGVRPDCGLAWTKCPLARSRPRGHPPLHASKPRWLGTHPFRHSSSLGPMSSAPDPWMPKRRLSRRPPSDAGSKSPADSTTAVLLPLAYPSPNPNPVGGARVRRP